MEIFQNLMSSSCNVWECVVSEGGKNSSFPLADFLKACPVSRVSDSSCAVEHVF